MKAAQFPQPGFDVPVLPHENDAVELRDRYTAPPFTTLHVQSGEWQERKRQWLLLGIQSEIGREGVKAYNINSWLDGKNIKCAPAASDGVSIFDPVLCECAYQWWAPAGGQIIDPFAGGSVRGIVAWGRGYRYWGCDLRAAQISANEEQAESIYMQERQKERPLVKLDRKIWPVWVAGDSLERVVDAPVADFLWSCPPYGNLEVYSDDPRDISGMSYEDFLRVYRQIICKSCDRLKDNRFAAFVVGNYRDKAGHLLDFVGETVRAFQSAGLHLYNEVILVTPAASAAMRAAKSIGPSRKCTRTHQNVLMFVKGDWKKAAEYLNKAEVVSRGNCL